MSDWIVVVSRQRDHHRKRVFVEDVVSEDEAEKMGLFKLGVTSRDHDARAELVDEKVSPETPYYSFKEMYETALVELNDTKRELEEANNLVTTYRNHIEEIERERDRLIHAQNPVQNKLNRLEIDLADSKRQRDRLQEFNDRAFVRFKQVKTEFEEIQKLFNVIGKEI